MLRFAELALFAAPFAAFILWRLFAVESDPALWIVITAGCLVVLLAGTLFWLRHEEVLPQGTGYVPAQLQNGRIVPGRPGTQ